MAQQAVFTVENEDGEQVVLPSKYVVCSGCEGTGVQDHPAFANGITSSEWHGPDWDDESRKRYLRGGYDVQCECCHGQRVELVADDDRMTDAQKAMLDAMNRADREFRAVQRAERAFGC